MAFEGIGERATKLLLDLCREMDESKYLEFHAETKGVSFILLVGKRGVEGKQLEQWNDGFTEADIRDLDAAHYISAIPAGNGYKCAIREKGRKACQQPEAREDQITTAPIPPDIQAALPEVLPEGFALGPYKIVGPPLGKGGMARVYKAANGLLDGKVFAIKVLSGTHMAIPESILRFKREAKLLQRIHSDNVVRAFEYQEVQGRPYYVMEFSEGRSLRTLVTSKKRLSLEEFAPLLKQAVQGLRALHALEVVHRDVTPANFVVEEGGRLVIIDLGVAHLPPDGELVTQQGAFLGTLDYASPEQCLGQVVDRRSDVYCLGLVTYFALVGRRPVEINSAADLMKHVKDEVKVAIPELEVEIQPVLAKALEKKRDDRFHNVVLFGDAFARAAASLAAPPDLSTITIADGTSLNLARSSAGKKARVLIDEAEWATHHLLNDKSDDLLGLRKRYEQWERGCLLVMAAAGILESEQSDFRVLVTFEPKGLAGINPEHARLRDVIAEKIARLKVIARRVETGARSESDEGVASRDDSAAGAVATSPFRLEHDPTCKQCVQLWPRAVGRTISLRVAVFNRSRTIDDASLRFGGVKPSPGSQEYPSWLGQSFEAFDK